MYVILATFIYEHFKDNLLRYDADKELLSKIMEANRTKAQVHDDNSEDGASRDRLRFLERTRLLSGFLEELHNPSVRNPEIVYSSYPQSQQRVYDELEKARGELTESLQRGSGPDLNVTQRNAGRSKN